MSWVATAVVGSAVIGGVASNSASKRAAEGQEKALEANAVAVADAEGKVNNLFGEAEQQQSQAFTSAMDYLSGAYGKQIQPFQQGNMAAQAQISRGLPQIQNAIMGNPVDLSGFKPRAIAAPTLDREQFKPKSNGASNMNDIQQIIQASLKNLQIGETPMQGGLTGYDTFNQNWMTR